MRRRLLAVLGSLVLLLSLSAPVTAIVYGQRDTNEDYPNVGALIGEFEVEGELLEFIVCSGTLIEDGDHDGSSNLFLTAAHCIFAERLSVSFDAAIPTDPDKFGSVVPGGSTMYDGTAHPHPSFACCGANDTFDIAVVVLDEEVPIAPAPIATANQLGEMTNQELKSTTFTAVGYGAVRDTRTKAWQSLSDSEGFRSFADQSALSLTNAWLTLSMNEATGDGGTCYGDSGGPHFLPDGTVVSLTVTGDVFCKATDKTYRVDTPAAQAFLAEFLAVD